MTTIINKELYCPNCKKTYIAPVMMSTNSFMIERDEELRKRYENGTLFKNFCPKCGEELVKNPESK